MDSTTMKGTVQGYFDRAFDEMTDKELETPLANSGLGVKAKLAPNSGTFVQFRKFGDLALATEANSDSPKMYGETEEPSASMVVPDDIFQVSTQDLAGYLSFRPKLLLQDPSDIMAVSKRRLNRWVRRMIHTVVNDRFVRPLAVAVTNLDSAYVAAPKPFRVIYAGGAAAFAGMREDSFVTIADIFRGAALLRNGRAPSSDGRYACVMDSAGIEQIKFGDSKFTDLIKGFEDKNNRVFGAGDMIDYGGAAFVRQDDPYRCNLPDVGGAVQTRCNTGKVRARRASLRRKRLRVSGSRRGGLPDAPDPGPDVQMPGHHDHRHAADLRGAHGLPGDGGRAQLRPQPGLHLGLRRAADRPAG